MPAFSLFAILQRCVAPGESHVTAPLQVLAEKTLPANCAQHAARRSAEQARIATSFGNPFSRTEPARLIRGEAHTQLHYNLPHRRSSVHAAHRCATRLPAASLGARSRIRMQAVIA